MHSFAHTSPPWVLLTEPAGQGLQIDSESAPCATLYFPMPHKLQCKFSLSLTPATPYLPAGHKSQKAASPALYDPTAQDSQLETPASDLVPLGQGAHTVPLANEYLPGAHTLQLAAPSSETYPNGHCSHKVPLALL